MENGVKIKLVSVKLIHSKTHVIIANVYRFMKGEAVSNAPITLTQVEKRNIFIRKQHKYL